MIIQLQKIVDKVNNDFSTSYTLNTTNAYTDVDIYDETTSQEDWKASISRICEFTSNLWYFNGDEVVGVDMLTGIGDVEITDFILTNNSLTTSYTNKILNTYRAKWQSTKYDVNVQTTKQVDKQLSISTGYSSGTQGDIPMMSFKSDDIITILNRFKSVYLLKPISIQLTEKQNIVAGQHITLSSDVATGEFVVTELKKENGKQSISGLGSITYL